jgi:hypothetical protein
MKQVTRPLSEFKSFEALQHTLVGSELRHTLTKGQVGREMGQRASPRPNSSTPWQPHPSLSRAVSITLRNFRQI